MNKPARPKKRTAELDSESRGSLSDFIASDDSEGEQAYIAVKKAFQRDYSDDDDIQEAGFSSQEEEEEYSRWLGDREDKEQQILIQKDLEEEEQYRK